MTKGQDLNKEETALGVLEQRVDRKGGRDGSIHREEGEIVKGGRKHETE